MYKIVSKRQLAPKINMFEIVAPEIARKSHPGQFIILVYGEKAERIPLTLSGCDPKKGTITFAFAEVGKTTKELGQRKQGDNIGEITGPLGVPSEIRKFGRILCVAGGVMIAPMLLQVKALKETSNTIDVVLGARKQDLIFYEEEMKSVADNVYIATDDGSRGNSGLNFLRDLLAKNLYDRCVTMGPVAMMKDVCEMTKQFAVPTVVTLTPIMIDGNGMCGACRVQVGDKTQFACVDGPEFDGHKVNFDLLVQRQMVFLSEERLSSLLWEKGKGGICGGK